MNLAFFTLRRIGLIVPTLLLVSVLVFSLQHLLPGDPAIALSGDEHDPAVVEHLREKYGFNRPVVVQYGMWLGSMLEGDLGISYRNQVSVLDLIATKLPSPSSSACHWASLRPRAATVSSGWGRI